MTAQSTSAWLEISEIQAVVELRDPADIGRFRFAGGERIFKLPFPSNYFDFA